MTSITNGDASRKRVRSASGSSSASGASSPKRAVSDSPAPATLGKLNQAGQSTLDENGKEIDEYMQSQGENLSLADAASPANGTLVETASSLTPRAKLERIEELKARPLQEGDVWYIISRAWYGGWASACGGPQVKGAPEDESQVKSIDNSSIVGSSPFKIKDDVQEGTTIELLPDEAWSLLVQWYGQPDFVFPRKVVARGLSKMLSVELFPFHFLIYFLATENPEKPVEHPFSRSDTIANFVDDAVQPRLLRLGAPNASYRIWIVNPAGLLASNDDETQRYTPQTLQSHAAEIVYQSYSQLPHPSSATLEETELADGDRVIVEVKEGEKWLMPEPGLDGKARLSAANTVSDAPLFASDAAFFGTMESTYRATPIVPGSNRSNAKSDLNGIITGSSFAMIHTRSNVKRTRGTVGLNNLGNTCFMNSALQCLAHLPELAEYFLTGVYLNELNPKNPLSTGGELAKSYGNLMHNLFDPGANFSFAPRDLKAKISRHAPAFSGYMQHDTQELLAFLLDGLHEDLNRIQKKPYFENPDWEGGGDKELIELAQKYWKGYKSRNDSVIVDLFQGQYKSKLVCPECGKVSITFDPFMYLTLPLPFDKTWEHDVYFVTWEMDKPNYQVHLNIPRTSTFKDVKHYLAKWFDCIPENILAAEIFSNRFYKFFLDHSSVTEIAENDTIFFYELPIPSGQTHGAPRPKPTDPLILPIYTVSPSTYRGYGYGGYGSYGSNMSAPIRYNSRFGSKEVYGYPFFIAIPHEINGSEDAIYEAIVDRYQMTTNMANDLYTWHEEDTAVGSDDDAVMVTAPQSEASSLDGDPVKDEVEDDMEEVKIPEAEPPRVVRGAAKKELFGVQIMENNFDPANIMGHGSGWDHGHPANMHGRHAEMEADMTDSETSDGVKVGKPSLGFLRPKDGIVCEWDNNLQLYYFGLRGSGKESRWNEAVQYTDPVQAAAAASKKEKKKTGISIEDCLNEFVQEEELGADDPWYCPKCKKHQQATKKFDIWKVPDILVVHLKRFSNSRMLRDKIDVLVNFPITGLNMERRIEERVVAKRLSDAGVALDDLELGDLEEPAMYDLFAVDEHMGGLGGGHYRAYAKNPDDDKWYHFDDARVEETVPEKSVTPLAYLLFYRRRTHRPIGGDTTAKIETAKLNPPAPPTPPPEPERFPSSSRAVMLRPVVTPHSQNLSLAGDNTPLTSPTSTQSNDLIATDRFRMHGPAEADLGGSPHSLAMDDAEDPFGPDFGFWPNTGPYDGSSGIGQGLRSQSLSPAVSEDHDHFNSVTDRRQLNVDEDYDGGLASPPAEDIIVEREADQADDELPPYPPAQHAKEE